MPKCQQLFNLKKGLMETYGRRNRTTRGPRTWITGNKWFSMASPNSFSASVVSCSMVRPLFVVDENCQLSTSATWSHVPTGGLVKKFTFCPRMHSTVTLQFFSSVSPLQPHFACQGCFHSGFACRGVILPLADR